MRVLIIGAGVTGSLFASYLINGKSKLEKKLKEEVDIRLLARGETYKRIRENGLKINHVVQKLTTIDRIPVIKNLESRDRYDYVLVFLRKTQIAALLPELSPNRSDTFVFFGNNGTGLDEISRSLPVGKTALGFAKVGGRREGDTLFSVHGKRPALTIGPTGTGRKNKIARLVKGLTLAGISVSYCGRMDSWLKYHIALVSPLAQALYRDGGDNVSLSGNKILLNSAVKAVKEGYSALKELKYPVRPLKLRLMMLMPDSIIRGKLSKLLASEMGRLLVYDHCMAAPEEMEQISEELFLLTKNAQRDLSHLRELSGYC